jgi:8-oxo-dGTP diphosphatase
MSTMPLTHHVVTALIEDEGCYLLTQRQPHAVFPLRWEFPGGRVEDGETDQGALVRELGERLGARVEVGELYSRTERAYEGFGVDLRVYRCRLLDKVLVPQGVHTFRFVSLSELGNYPFPPADEESVARLLGTLAPPAEA